MYNNLRRVRSQAMIESIFILTLLSIFLIGTYLIGKLILIKTTQVTLNRNNAFNSTYLENNKPLNTLTKNQAYEIDATYKYSNESANSTDDYNSYGLFSKVLNLMSNTEKYETTSKTDIEKELSDLIKYGKPRLSSSTKLFMDKGTFYKSGELKAALYSIAFAKALVSGKTKLESLGKDLLETSRDFREKEDIFVK